MTNFASIVGGFVWTAVASVLMMAALEPVALNEKAEAPIVVLAAAPAAHAAS
jgi:hypothetical protein